MYVTKTLKSTNQALVVLLEYPVSVFTIITYNSASLKYEEKPLDQSMQRAEIRMLDILFNKQILVLFFILIVSIFKYKVFLKNLITRDLI